MDEKIELIGEEMEAVPPLTWKQNASIQMMKIAEGINKQRVVLIGTAFVLSCLVIITIFSPDWKTLTIGGWASVLITVFTIAIILMHKYPPSFVMFGGLAVVYGLNLVDSTGAFAGFSNTGVLTDSLMFIVAKAIELSGILNYVTKYILRQPHNYYIALFRLLVVSGILSMFINNTPITFMMIPVVQLWSQQIQIDSSRFLIPMAYIIIIGGVCTTIGTSTNIVLVGSATSVDPSITIGFFDPAIPGIPVFIVGVIYLTLFSNLLVSKSQGADIAVSKSMVPSSRTSSLPNEHRQYTSAYRIADDSSLIGQQIKATQLVKMSGVALIDVISSKNFTIGQTIEDQPRSVYGRLFDSILGSRTQMREMSTSSDMDYYSTSNEAYGSDSIFESQPAYMNISSVGNVNNVGSGYGSGGSSSARGSGSAKSKNSNSNNNNVYGSQNEKKVSEHVISAGDILFFRGSLRDMYIISQVDDGLQPVDIDQIKKIEGKNRCIVEVVISPSAGVIGQTVKECQFRSKYNAVILGVYRDAHNVVERIGDICLSSGDVLMLETTPDFLKVYKNSPDFLLVSESLSGSSEPNTNFVRMIAVVILMIMMISASALQIYSTLQGTCLLIVVYVVIGAITWEQSFASIQAYTMMLIACAFALGNAMEQQNATTVIADSLIDFFILFGRIGVLGGLFLCTSGLCAIMSNTAVVSIMFPIAQQFAYSAGLSIKSVTITLMMASSALFPSPLGYQVLFSVYSIGGYKFSDFVKLGTPLFIIYFVISVPIVYFMWADDFHCSDLHYYEYLPANVTCVS